MAFNTQYIIPLIFELVVTVFAIIVIAKIGQKYSQKKNKVTLYMFLFSLFITLAILISAIFRILEAIDAWNIITVGTNSYLNLLTLTVSLIGISNIFLLLFTLEVFYGSYTDKGRNNTILIVYSLIAAIFVIYTLATALIVDNTTNFGLNISIWIFLIIISAIVYIFMFQAIWKIVNQMENPKQKRNTKIISFSPLSFLLYLILFMINSIMGSEFSIYYYIGWIFVLITFITLYIGIARRD